MNSEPIKVLLVDDTPENLVALEALTRRPGVEVLMARSGTEALELLLAHEISLVLLDVQMPEMDGFEVAELMRGAERTKHVPIIFVTAGARDPQRAFKGYESGAVDFLYKPIDPYILGSKVDVFVELARQRRELAEALRFHELFVAVLGHDLRNPLAAMVTGVEVLRVALDDQRNLELLRRMKSSGHRMERMIDQLLDLTRARLAGGTGFRTEHELVDVRELVRKATEELRISHPGREISISADAEASVVADAGRLMQLFSNLISNALSHGVPGTPVRIVVSGRADDVTVAVHNEGTIPPELRAVIFEPFRRARAVRSSDGLGLGLFIALQIAHAHAGELTLGDATTGTTFTVCLPRQQLSAGRSSR